MPKWGIEMTEGTLAEWKLEEGAAFSRGQLLCLIETAKITNEVEAEWDGVLGPRAGSGRGRSATRGHAARRAGRTGRERAGVDAFIAGFRPADASVARAALRRLPLLRPPNPPRPSRC
jgi:pyruvate dehydrogenase E2 component (dihydrolipoamide acetyltransferase)